MLVILRKSGCIKLLVIIFFTIVILYYYQLGVFYLYMNNKGLYLVQNGCESVTEHHTKIVSRFYNKRKKWKTSNLGSILFKNIDRDIFIHHTRENRTYVVLIWKYFDWLKKRHIIGFNKNEVEDPLSSCSVKNCIFTGNDSLIQTVDAVVVHMQKGVFPKVETRNVNQRWVFLSDESPMHTFSLSGRGPPSISEMAGVFNWSMTYRSDADIPVPYGRTVPLEYPITIENNELVLQNLIPNWSVKVFDRPVAVLMSNCKVGYRMNFLKNLKRFIPVDVHGKCADGSLKMSCPGHFKSDCKIMSRYLFYLALENSRCRQYLTEKSFYHAYSKGAIPVITGPPLEDCEKLLPPKSFIHVDQFKSIEELAQYIRYLTGNVTEMLEFHKWRYHFDVVNEHGYFGDKSFHYCRICEALNYNDGENSIYDEDSLRLFFDKKLTCNGNPT